MPNNFLVSFDVRIFFAFIFISSFPFIASIGDILAAFLAGIIHEKYIVIADINILIITTCQGNAYTNISPDSISCNK